MSETQSARDMRAAQREEARQQEGGLESLETEWVSTEGVDSQVPPTSPTVGQLKVVVHEIEHDDEVIMPDLEYARAVEKLIKVENPEVKKKAKKIAFTKRTLERAVEKLEAVIKSAGQVYMSTGSKQDKRDPHCHGKCGHLSRGLQDRHQASMRGSR